MVLKEVKDGNRVKLVSMQKGCKFNSRLADMGLIPGMELKVLSNVPGRPMIVCVDGCRLSLCRKIAEKIKVNKQGNTDSESKNHKCHNHECHMDMSSMEEIKCHHPRKRRRNCHGRRMHLRQMEVNQRGKILSVKASGELGRRIRDMGLIPNTEIQVVGRAPLKDPVALRLRDFTLSLRNNEADHILVEVPGGECG